MISWMDAEECADYAHLATAAVATSLARVQVPATITTCPPASSHIAAGLQFAGLPAALAVLRSEQATQAGQLGLLSLVVAPPLRRLGLARDLLTWVSSELKQQGWRGLSLSYPLDHSCTPAMEKLTSRTEGWLHRPGLQLMQLDRQGAAQLVQRLTPLMRRARRAERFSFRAWADLAVTTRQGLGASLDAPPWAHPRDDGGQDPLQVLDPWVSTVLLDDDRAAGWITAHRVGERLFRVSQWWVKPELQGCGAALLLLHQAVQGALQSPQAYTSGTFGMEPGNRQAINLCQRKIAPFACSVNLQRRAWIQLNDHTE